jgi:ATP-dependent RNA helicase SUPV3L1/SUV3
MFGELPLLLSVGSAEAGTATRADPPRLPPTKGSFPPVSAPPQSPDRRRKRNVARDLQSRDDDRAAARVEKLAQQSWVDGAEPELPVRTTRPENVVFHLGPTNSGKTYDSLLALAKNGRGVYAAPLRQLAHEAYARLSAQLPPGTVGLSTGEEEIDPDAPIVCCTVEKAPMRGDLLVLDESHWVADPDRGHHWARLVLTGDYREMHLISAAEAYLLLKPLVSDAKKITVVNHKRLSRLDVLRTPVRPDDVRPQTLVVAFSRKAVYAVASALAPKRPGKVGVLYGALPPATRREVIDRFTRGETEVLVTTDVIGHGINVPATTVLFAETTKFDGVERRPLRTWETAQIAGRAGRYGLTGHGSVGVLAGVTGLRADAGLLKAGAEVARGDAMSDLPKRAPRLRPELDDLGAFEPVDLPEALTRWMAWARAATRDHAMTADDVTGLIVRVHALLPLLRGPLGAAGDLWTVWRLINLPIDYNPPRRTRWLVLATAALQSAVGMPVAPETVLEPMPAKGTVEDYEQAAAAARDAQTLLRSFPDVAGLTSEDAAEVEDACADRITELLPDAISLSASGRCSDCGTGIAPWFTTCRDCSVGTAGRGPSRGAPPEGHRRHQRPAGTGGRPAAGSGGRAAASEGGRRGRGSGSSSRGTGGRPGAGRSDRPR